MVAGRKSTPTRPGALKSRRQLEEQRPLDFNRDRARPLSRREQSERFPAQRVAQAGMSGGEAPTREITADDATPETLLGGEPSHTPSVQDARSPDDQALGIVGAASIGGGGGSDEAELAEIDPVGRREARRLRALSRRHASDAQFVEPAGAAEARERERLRTLERAIKP